MAGPFSGPDSSHRPIRHAGPSGSSRSPRPAVHPPTFGTRSGRLSIRPLPEPLPAIGPSCLAEPLPAVHPLGLPEPLPTIGPTSPSRNHIRPFTHSAYRNHIRPFATSLPEPRPPKNARFATHPVTPRPHLSARSSDSHAPGRSDRHTSDPPVSAPPKATKKAIPESHWIPGSPDRQRSTEHTLQPDYFHYRKRKDSSSERLCGVEVRSPERISSGIVDFSKIDTSLELLTLVSVICEPSALNDTL